MDKITTIIWFIFLFTFLAQTWAQESHNFTLTKTWNNQTTPDNVTIYLSFSIQKDPSGRKSLRINIDAPYFGDPAAPNASIEDPFMGLWEFEVVEVFFLGDDEEYLEIELAPSGHYLMLYLKGVRNDTGRELPLSKGSYLTEIINEERWTGEAWIPSEYFPCNPALFNGYAIHKSGPDRRYMALFPVKEGELNDPNFHYFPPFQSITWDEELNPDACGGNGRPRFNFGLSCVASVIIVGTFMMFMHNL